MKTHTFILWYLQSLLYVDTNNSMIKYRIQLNWLRNLYLSSLFSFDKIFFFNYLVAHSSSWEEDFPLLHLSDNFFNECKWICIKRYLGIKKDKEIRDSASTTGSTTSCSKACAHVLSHDILMLSWHCQTNIFEAEPRSRKKPTWVSLIRLTLPRMPSV